MSILSDADECSKRMRNLIVDGSVPSRAELIQFFTVLNRTIGALDYYMGVSNDRATADAR